MILRRLLDESNVLSLSTDTSLKRFGGDIRKVVGVGDKAFSTAIKPQQAGVVLTLEEKEVIGPGWRRDAKGTWPILPRGERVGGSLGESSAMVKVLSLLGQDGCQLRGKGIPAFTRAKIGEGRHRRASGGGKEGEPERREDAENAARQDWAVRRHVHLWLAGSCASPESQRRHCSMRRPSAATHGVIIPDRHDGECAMRSER